MGLRGGFIMLHVLCAVLVHAMLRARPLQQDQVIVQMVPHSTIVINNVASEATTLRSLPLSFPASHAASRAKQVLTQFVDLCFLDGKEPSVARNSLAATMFLHPRFPRPQSRSLPGAVQSMKGWMKASPPRAHMPLPQEVGVPSKVGEHDEAFVLKMTEFNWVCKAVVRLLMSKIKTKTHILFKVTAGKVNLFLRSLEAADLRQWIGVVHLYQLRHGETSRATATKAFDFADFQRQGRWKTTKAVHQYEKGGRYAQVLSALPVSMLVSVAALRSRLQHM